MSRSPASSPQAQEPQHVQAGDEVDLAASLRSLLMTIRRRIKMIFLVVTLGTGLAAYVGYNRAPSYTAQAMVMLQPKESQIVDLQAVAAGLGGDVTAVETEVKLLTSPVYLAQIDAKLNHPEQTGVEEHVSAGSFVAGLMELIPSDWLIATGLAQEKVEVDPEQEEAILRDGRIAQLSEGLKIKQEGRSLVLSVSYTSKDPKRAADIVNTLTNFYIDDQVSDKLGATKRATNWLEIRVAQLKAELETSEQAVESYRAKNRLLASRGLQLNAQQMADLTNMLVTTRAARSEKETRLRYIRSMQARGEQLESVTEVLESPYLINLWQQESVMQQQEAELLSTFGEKHPRVQHMQAEKQKIAEKIERETKRLVDNIQNEISVLAAKEKSIQSDIDSLVRQTDVTGQAEVELRQLERQSEANRRIYEDFLQRFKETKEQQEIVQANARIIAQAKPPTEPSSLPPSAFLLVGLLGSSMAGIGLAWLTERLDNGLRSGNEIEREFGLPCLGLVPHLPGIRRGYERRAHRYLLKRPFSAYGEAIRSIYTALRLSSIDSPAKVIQVTSSVPSEGKSTFATSLAALLAHTGQRTLLFDLDLRHPSVHREIEIPTNEVLGRYMIGEVDYSELVHHDEASGLDVIAVRQPAVNPAAVVSSQRLRNLFEQLRKDYDYIIVDSTPVLGISDSKVTAELVDVLLFVVRWEKTTRDIVQDAMKELTELKFNIGGVVLTQVDVKKQARYGYGGIGAYYHKYKQYYRN